MQFQILFSTALLGAVQSQITGFGNQSVDYGGDAHYGCAANDLKGVLQVTWQRLYKNESIENLATYSQRFGQQVNEPNQGKIIFTEASLSSTAITVKNVTWGDESCYICSFNVYPEGSRRTQTCLKVKGISEVTTAVHASSTEHGEEDVEVTFTCSAAGKPPPTIHWDLPSWDLRDSQSQTTAITNSDSTFTSTGNISLQVPSDWNGYVDCVVNRGMVGEKRERIPLSLHSGKKKDQVETFPALLVVLLISGLFVSIIVVAATLCRLRFERNSRAEFIL